MIKRKLTQAEIEILRKALENKVTVTALGDIVVTKTWGGSLQATLNGETIFKCASGNINSKSDLFFNVLAELGLAYKEE